MERGFSITFVTAVAGLTGDLGLSHRQTVLVTATPGSVREGFKRATMRMTGPMPDAAADLLGREEKVSAAPETAPNPAPEPELPQPQPAKRPWWRI
jgi:hypothetical protein